MSEFRCVVKALERKRGRDHAEKAIKRSCIILCFQRSIEE